MYLHQFKQFLNNEKRYSVNTVSSYLKDLDQFQLFLKKEYDVSQVIQVNHFHIRSWIVSLMENEISARSILRKLSTLKTYFKYLDKKGIITINPIKKVVSPKTSKRLPVYVEEANMTDLLSQFGKADTFEEKRDKVVLELLYCTGIRRAELINLKDSDLDRSLLQIKVLGKGNKERIIPIDRKLMESLNDYIEVKREESGAEFLIVTNKGDKVYPKFIHRLVHKYLNKVSTLEKKSPHVLRHTFATHLINNGADLNAIKELLGHASLAATQVYTHNSIEKLKDIYKNAHPRA